jgi:hypothetical protein
MKGGHHMAHNTYPVSGKGANAEYHKFKVRLGLESPILNSRIRHPMDRISDRLWTVEGQRSLLAELLGDEDGVFLRREMGLAGETRKMPARLTVAKEALAELDEKFAESKVKATREGRTPPTEMPPEMLSRRYLLEATRDLILEEIDTIQKLIAAHDDQKQTEAKKAILVWGPQGTGKLRNGLLSEIDGQKCIWDPKQKCMTISEPDSPYFGMKVEVYRELVCKPWRRRDDEWHRTWAKMTSEERTDAIRQGKNPPICGPTTVNRSELPPRPEGV